MLRCYFVSLQTSFFSLCVYSERLCGLIAHVVTLSFFLPFCVSSWSFAHIHGHQDNSELFVALDRSDKSGEKKTLELEVETSIQRVLDPPNETTLTLVSVLQHVQQQRSYRS